jgi:hypothetical protein
MEGKREWAGGRVLRVAILLGEPGDKLIGFFMEMVHALRQAGQEAEFAPKTQIELGDSAVRVARMVEATEADAWVVFSGSREVLDRRRVSRFNIFPLPALGLSG